MGGAFIADVIEQAWGFNPWIEWARIEVALARGGQYTLPALRKEYARRLAEDFLAFAPAPAKVTA